MTVFVSRWASVCHLHTPHHTTTHTLLLSGSSTDVYYVVCVCLEPDRSLAEIKLSYRKNMTHSNSHEAHETQCWRRILHMNANETEAQQDRSWVHFYGFRVILISFRYYYSCWITFYFLYFLISCFVHILVQVLVNLLVFICIIYFSCRFKICL